MSGASAKTLYALTLVKRGHNYDQAARKAKCSASAVRQQCLKQGIRVNYIPGADVVNIAHLDDLGVSDFKNCQKHGFSPKDALRMAEEDMELRRTRSEGFVTIGQAANSVLAKAVRNG